VVHIVTTGLYWVNPGSVEQQVCAVQLTSPSLNSVSVLQLAARWLAVRRLFPQTRQTARGAVSSLQKAVCRWTACCAGLKLPPLRNKVNLPGKLGLQNCMAPCVISLLGFHCRTVTNRNAVWRPVTVCQTWLVHLAGTVTLRAGGGREAGM